MVNWFKISWIFIGLSLILIFGFNIIFFLFNLFRINLGMRIILTALVVFVFSFYFNKFAIEPELFGSARPNLREHTRTRHIRYFSNIYTIFSIIFMLVGFYMSIADNQSSEVNFNSSLNKLDIAIQQIYSLQKDLRSVHLIIRPLRDESQYGNYNTADSSLPNVKQYNQIYNISLSSRDEGLSSGEITIQAYNGLNNFPIIISQGITTTESLQVHVRYLVINNTLLLNESICNTFMNIHCEYLSENSSVINMYLSSILNNPNIIINCEKCSSPRYINELRYSNLLYSSSLPGSKNISISYKDIYISEIYIS